MYRRVLMSFALKSGACADCEGQTGALSGADVRKSRICLILRINIHPLARSAVILAGSFQHCTRQVCIPFLPFFPSLSLSISLLRSEVLAETHSPCQRSERRFREHQACGPWPLRLRCPRCQPCAATAEGKLKSKQKEEMGR